MIKDREYWREKLLDEKYMENWVAEDKYDLIKQYVNGFDIAINVGNGWEIGKAFSFGLPKEGYRVVGKQKTRRFI